MKLFDKIFYLNLSLFLMMLEIWQIGCLKHFILHTFKFAGVNVYYYTTDAMGCIYYTILGQKLSTLKNLLNLLLPILFWVGSWISSLASRRITKTPSI